MRWLGKNKDWLFSGLAVYLIGLATGSFKDALPFFGTIVPAPIWILLIIAFLPAGIASAILFRLYISALKKAEQAQRDSEFASESQKEAAFTDPLTQLWNLRKLQTIYKVVIPELDKSGKETCGLLVDIDGFAEFQKEPHTFRQGTDLIRQVGKTLKRRVSRPNDFVIRYGGDEFLIFLGETPISGAEKFAHYLQAWLSEDAFYMEGDQKRKLITVSIGITKYSFGHDSPESFEDRLWNGLREAKSKPGKGAIVIK